MAEIDNKLSIARSIIRDKEPYLMDMILSFIPHYCEGLKTLGVTKHHVLYLDPVWALSIPDQELAAALVHEAHHAFRGHVDRGEGYPDKDQANIAMDLTINDGIRDAGWKLPHGVYCEEYSLPTGLTFEQYYEALSKRPKKKAKSGCGKAPSTPEQAPGVGHGKCGGIAGNPANQELEKQLDAENQGGRSKEEQVVAIQQTAHAIKTYVQSNGRGSVPSWMEEYAAKVTEAPKVSWRRELAAVTRKVAGQIISGGRDYSIRRPSKRSATRGILRPSLIDRVPNVLIVLDTSGSMSLDGEIKDALIETVGIIKAIGLQEVHFLMADMEVSGKIKRLRVRDVLKGLKISGRGGTSFIPAFEEAQKMKPRPDLLIYLTDGDGEAPAVKPANMHVIWGIVPGHHRYAPAAWGRTIMIKDG